MEDALLIKYFNGEATEEEKARILAWTEASDENLQYFSKISDMWFVAQVSVLTSDKVKVESIRSSIKGMRIGRDLQTTQSKTNINGGNLHRSVGKVFYFGAAAVVACLLLINIFYKNNNFKELNQNSSVILTETQMSSYLHTIYTPKGAKAIVILPDSSKVKLNSDTKIIFPDKFIGKTREVIIDGEGYFNVVKDSLRPMIVSTSKGYKIKVLGTKFNVCSYSDDDFSKTTLIDGVIHILSNDADNNSQGEKLVAELSIGESYVKKDVPDYKIPEVSAPDEEIAWTQDRLVFNDTPMNEVIKKLERWHGANFVIKNPILLSVKMTAEYENESLVQMLESIKFSTGITYSIKDDIVYLNIEK